MEDKLVPFTWSCCSIKVQPLKVEGSNPTFWDRKHQCTDHSLLWNKPQTSVGWLLSSNICGWSWSQSGAAAVSGWIHTACSHSVSYTSSVEVRSTATFNHPGRNLTVSALKASEVNMWTREKLNREQSYSLGLTEEFWSLSTHPAKTFNSSWESEQTHIHLENPFCRYKQSILRLIIIKKNNVKVVVCVKYNTLLSAATEQLKSLKVRETSGAPGCRPRFSFVSSDQDKLQGTM